MLKRNDLGKQFELLVQQEIKNHNDQMLATNLSINELRKAIDENKKTQELVNSEFGSVILKTNQNHERLSDFLLKISQKLDSHVNDSRDLNERNGRLINEMIEGIEKAFTVYDKLLSTQISLEESNIDLKTLMKCLGESVSYEMQEWSRKVYQDLEKMKKEILSLPSEAKAVKIELEKKIDIFKVDCEGLLREVAVWKKDSFVFEKKFENLYTLIERLDKRISQ